MGKITKKYVERSMSPVDVDKTASSNKRCRVVDSCIPKDSVINGTWI